MARRGQTRGRRPTQAPEQRERCSWATLPLELREMIFGVLEDSIQAGVMAASACASVCKAWRGYFEPLVFRRLTLTLERLNELEARVARHQRQYVQHIWFRFERSVKPCATHIQFRPELDAMRFHTAMYQLFLILSEWPTRGTGQPGIALELTAFSTVDPEYSMKDTVPEQLRGADLTVDSETLNALYDRPPKPMRPLTPAETEQSVRVRQFYRPAGAVGLTDRPLPQVTLITDLTVRRQMHISFFAAHIGHIVSSLPKLEFLTYEPRAYHSYDVIASRTNAETMRAIITRMPSTIRRLQVFEDAPCLYDQGVHPMQVSDRDGSVARFLAEVTQDTEPEAIAISFLIDAVHFFSDFWTPQISRLPWKLGWLKLTSLVMTSAVLTSRRCNEIPPLLTAAARAACHMPKLEVLELYYVAPKHGAIFTYIHDEEGSIVCWESTWKWTLPSEVVSAWRQAAAFHGTGELTHEERCIPKSQLRWGGSIVSLLRTRTTVVHPITYGNMMNGLNHI
ncbi:hypothetical protein CCMA1212_006325 [Trichoderma ghanense]|uniref:DUF6546 domain-containing protein n=1 Tax=Trichoderma ghanense TaxID=65468 RepID=A0ABY2H0S6_9HYPO